MRVPPHLPDDDGTDGILLQAAVDLACLSARDTSPAQVSQHLNGWAMRMVAAAVGTVLADRGDGLIAVCASGTASLRLDELQLAVDTSPCRSAHELGRTISAPDLSSWPELERMVAALPEVSALYSIPLLTEHGSSGVLNLYAATGDRLHREVITDLERLGRVAAAKLRDIDAYRRERAVGARMQRLLDDRGRVEAQRMRA